MSSLDFLVAYFSNPLSWGLPLAALALILGCYTGYLQKRRSPEARSVLLEIQLSTSLFVWSFLAASLFLCYFLGNNPSLSQTTSIKFVSSAALVSGLVVAFPLSMLLRRKASISILKNMQGLRRMDEKYHDRFRSVLVNTGVTRVALMEAENTAPITFAVDGDRRAVIVSKKMTEILSLDELETVFAHEIAHLRNGDSIVKALAMMYRKLIPIDPLIKLVEPAIHREREFMADEFAAKITRKPLELASALVKIHENLGKLGSSSIFVFSIMGNDSGLLSRHPPLKERVERLIQMADTERERMEAGWDNPEPPLR